MGVFPVKHPHLKELEALLDEMKMIGIRYDASQAQVAAQGRLQRGRFRLLARKNRAGGRSGKSG